MLECGDGTIYTGITDDPDRRLKAHSEGRGAKYTRGRGPLTLRYREEVPDKSTALKRECMIKRMRRAEKMKMICKYEREAQSLLENSRNAVYTEHRKVQAEDLPGEE